ncbi:hypothetical protein AXF42_Ash011267 [Apostasia shenzhenica]|uniref:Uncharacterized protein n=1 Tax=Apostasia shenzhenica TaxID=1088818 RepID=A0A2I0AE17_9ASPA|nr:hypothetical protein AXF42_Ash011267 [Apostasia shenzhenica]
MTANEKTPDMLGGVSGPLLPNAFPLGYQPVPGWPQIPLRPFPLGLWPRYPIFVTQYPANLWQFLLCAAKKRSEVLSWLNSLFPDLRLPSEATEWELRVQLLDGSIFNDILRKLNPSVVDEVKPFFNTCFSEDLFWNGPSS